MKHKTHFQVDPRLASILGESYRSSEYALKELVDNAWDADASTVRISLPEPLTAKPVIIEDDGTGMTEQEVTQEYLFVASSRVSRKGERTQGKNRLVKGRKGIGKFAGLLAADHMSIESSARGIMTVLSIRKKDLLEADRNLESIALPYDTVNCPIDKHGTKITLSDLNQTLAFPNPDNLRELLILEYGRQQDFRIYVNGNILDIEDIPGETFNNQASLQDLGLVKIRFTIAEGRKQLKHSGIAIRINGKIVGRPSYFGLENDEEIPKKLLRRIYGEIEADGLVNDVTADWGAIVENSLALKKIVTWVYPQLKAGVIKVYANDVNLQKARLKQQINRELQKLPEHKRDFAQKALEKVLFRFYGENDNRIRTIISVILEAFEKDEYWAVIQKIDESKQHDVETFAEALETFGLLDMAIMARQTQGRLDFLDRLDELASDSSTLEKTMHTALERNLWVFGSQYTVMSSEKTLARVIEDYTNRKFSGSRANKRPDLFLAKDFLQRHLLIEFKRPSHRLTRDDENQAIKYRDDLTPNFGAISIIVVGGSVDSKISPYYESRDTKLMSYSLLISNARAELEWLLKTLRTSN